MSETYEGDGYEFSIRLLNYRRLRIHVTRAALEALNEGRLEDSQLGVLARRMPLLRKLALRHHEQTGSDRIIIGEKDLRNCEGLSQAR
jgi:hypothetical protein